MALLTSVVVLGLAACGARDGQPISTDGGPARLQLVAGAGGTAAAGAAAPEAAGMSVASDRMMMPAFIEYVFSGEAPDLTAPAGAWSFPAVASASAEQVQRLAAAFGISGAVEAVPAEQGGGWRVGPADWSGPSVQVMADGMLSWWFNPGPSEALSVPDCAIAIDEAVIDPALIDPAASEEAGGGSDAAAPPATDATATDATATDATAGTDVPAATLPADCVPQPPTNVPDAAAAESKARELFAALGIDLSSYEVDMFADEWGAYVNAYLRLDGVRTWLSMNVGFGAEGVITWAGGFLGQPERGDDYPRIGVEAAVARMNDQSALWMYPMASGGGDLAASAEVAVEPSGEAVPTEGVPVDDMPVDTTPIVVTLSNPTPSLEMFWAADGMVWLLPGYQFATSDGGTVSVLAVPDEFIEQAEPTPVDTLPLDTVPVEPVPATDGVGEPIPVDTEPGFEPPLTLDEAAAILVGLNEADAVEAATAAGIEMRVVAIDGVPQPVTEDFRISRYNVAVDRGVVTAVVSNG